MSKGRLLAILWLLPLFGFGQQLTKYRYWFDNSFSSAITTVSTDSVINLSLNVNNLLAGYHTLNFQSQDANEKWSAVISSHFLKLSQTTNANSKYRYWFDNDFDDAITIVSSDIEITLSIDVTNLTNGYHQLHFQTLDNTGAWSSITTSSILNVSILSAANINYRYWFDNNFNQSVTSASSTESINLSLNLDLLSDGYHQLNFQSQDGTGLWSSVVSQYFIKNNAAAVQLRYFKYWFNNNFANAKTKSVGVDGTGDFVSLIDLEGLSNGRHQINYQFCDHQDQWTAILSDSITVGPILNHLSEFPEIHLDKSQIMQGQKDSIWGDRLTTNGQVRISIRRGQELSSIADTLIHANSQGKIHFAYHFLSSLPAGVYSLIAFDQNTFGTSYPVRLNVTPAMAAASELKITSPVIQTSSFTNKPIKIRWIDRPARQITIIPGTGTVNAIYNIAFSKDGGNWQILTTRGYTALFNQPTDFGFDFTPTQNGEYRFRISDIYDITNSDVSNIVNVNLNTAGAEIQYVWDFSGNRPGSPIGLVADGTARIYVRVSRTPTNTKTINNVTLTVRDPDNLSMTDTSVLGKVYKAIDTSHYNLEANNATNVTANSDIVGPDGSVWMWYVAPNDFSRGIQDHFGSFRYLDLVADITYADNSTESITRQLEIVRPPLMLVHGWGGDESAWDDFWFLNSSNRFATSPLWKFKQTLHMIPDGGFDENARMLLNLDANGNYDLLHENPNSFSAFIRFVRNKKYACNRVDYIAHSMGGDMGRTAINFYPNQYRVNPAIFKNYSKGFINKFITLNTPHNGSPWADLLYGISLLPSYNFGVLPFRTILQTAYSTGVERNIVSAMYYKYPGTGLLDFNNPTNAIRNMRLGFNGVKFNKTYVKNHLIAGDIIDDVSVCTNVLTTLEGTVPEAKVFKKVLDVLNLNTCEKVDNYFNNNFGIANFISDCDIIVPLQSQLPGKDVSHSGESYSIYYGLNAWHLRIRKSSYNYGPSLKVFELLNSSVNSDVFADTIAANTSPGSTHYRTTSQANDYRSASLDTTKLIIRNPIRMSSVSIDSSFGVELLLKDTTNYKSIQMLFQGQIYNSTSKINNQAFSVQVSPQFPDQQLILASAIYDSAGYDVSFTDTLSVVVTRSSAIVGFYISPETKYLNAGQEYIPVYNCIGPNYISNISFVDSALAVFIADTSVVTYRDYNFVAKDSGTTYAVVSYKGFRDTLYFFIKAPFLDNEPSTATWIGVTSVDWNDGSNWSSGFVPGGADDVIIPSGTPYSPTVTSGPKTIRSLSVLEGAIVTVATNATLNILH
jgi:pimeloyl-ACP methyl ester carboxylesterase